MQCVVYLGAGFGQRVCVMSLMRSACTGFECQIFVFPEERLGCECDVIKLLVRIGALLQRKGGQREEEDDV